MAGFLQSVLEHLPEPMCAARATELKSLPLFAQALVACRLARRAALAMMAGADQALALEACDAIEAIARDADGWRDENPPIKALAKIRRTRENESALEAVRWAYDSVGVAQGALDFSVDATVTGSAQRCINAVCDDPRVSKLQIMIVLDGDIDQIAFACKEGNVNANDGVGGHVLGRLTPCHALSLIEPQPKLEDLYR